MLNSKKESGSAGKHETDSLESAFNIVIVEAPQKHSCLLWRKYQEKRGRAVLYYLGKVKKFQSEEIIIRLAGPQVVDFFRCQKGIASSVKEVLRQLILINRIHGKCFPSHGWIAEKIGVCRRTVQRAIKVLSSLGIISTSKSQHRRSLSYLIHLCEKVFGKFWPRTLEAKSKTKLRQVSCPEVSCPADVEEMITVVAQKRATKNVSGYRHQLFQNFYDGTLNVDHLRDQFNKILEAQSRPPARMKAEEDSTVFEIHKRLRKQLEALSS